MKNFEELENFITKNLNNNWQGKLKKSPYNLKSVTEFPSHPGWFMLVYNLFDSDLSNKIVKQCRGTVVEVSDKGAKVICAPYLKFFDINDNHADKINWDSKKLKTELKIDGQMIKMFKYSGRDYWVTNGGVGLNTPLNYETEEVHNYKELMSKALLTSGSVKGQGCVYDENDFSCRMDWVKNVPDGWTLMFELTSPQNKIIVNYQKTKLWFHGARDPEGNEHSPEEIAEKFSIPYEIPKRFNLSNKDEILAALKEFNGKENEGFVVVDEENWTRVKMKSPSYLAFKFVRDNDTPEAIWKLTITEQFDDILPTAPELKPKIDAQIKELEKFWKDFGKTILYAKDVWDNDFKGNDRKGFALWVQKNVTNPLSRIYFEVANGKGVGELSKEYLDKMVDTSKGYELYKSLLSVV